MIKLMNEMITEAFMSLDDCSYAFVHRETERGTVTLYALKVNTNATNCMQKRWKLNGKVIAAKKLECL